MYLAFKVIATSFNSDPDIFISKVIFNTVIVSSRLTNSHKVLPTVTIIVWRKALTHALLVQTIFLLEIPSILVSNALTDVGITWEPPGYTWLPSLRPQLTKTLCRATPQICSGTMCQPVPLTDSQMQLRLQSLLTLLTITLIFILVQVILYP
jgi:hypothetical protein